MLVDYPPPGERRDYPRPPLETESSSFQVRARFGCGLLVCVIGRQATPPPCSTTHTHHYIHTQRKLPTDRGAAVGGDQEASPAQGREAHGGDCRRGARGPFHGQVPLRRRCVRARGIGDVQGLWADPVAFVG